MTVLWADLPTRKVEYNPAVDTIVRQSDVNGMQLCEWRIGYRESEGWLEPVSEAMVFGTCLHHLVELDVTTGQEQADLMLNMRDWVEQILVEDYHWSLDLVPDLHLFFSELRVGYMAWRQQIHPHLGDEPIVAAEKEMLLPLGPGKTGTIFFKGTPDLVYPNVIRDTKTAGRGWKQDKADHSFQATVYPALVKQTEKKSIRDFVFDVYNRSTSSWETLRTHRTIAQINAGLRNLYYYGLKLEAGIYTATPVPVGFVNKRGWYCSTKFCSAWNVCDFKYINDNVDTNTVAERKW